MSVSSTSIGYLSRARPRRWRLRWGALLLLAPALAIMLVFFIIPVFDALYLSLTNGEFQGAHSRVFDFIGLANYQHMLHDMFLGNSLWKTAIYVGASAIIGQTILGIILALLSEQAWQWLRLSVGSIIVTAWVVPQIVQAIIWASFSQSGGTLDLLLGPSQANTNWLVSAPMLIICVANLWRSVALSMLLFGAGLRNISHEVKEAATLDGATYWQRLLYVILPIMNPTIVTNFIIVTLANLSDFTLIFALTQGGPGNATQTLPLYIYEQAFTYYELGYGTALAVLLIAIGAVASLIYVRLLRAEV
jgi:multiple sugar transport system permease protein